MKLVKEFAVRKVEHFFIIAFINSLFHCYLVLKYGCGHPTDVNVLIIQALSPRVLILRVHSRVVRVYTSNNCFYWTNFTATES